MVVKIAIPQNEIAEFCERHQIGRLSLFGSVLREDFESESDIDVLVKFKPEARVGLFALAAMEIELTALLGRKVDLRTAEEISRYFRQQVIESAETLYEHK